MDEIDVGPWLVLGKDLGPGGVAAPETQPIEPRNLGLAQAAKQHEARQRLALARHGQRASIDPPGLSHSPIMSRGDLQS
jgi:hypothetical protein